MFGFIHIFAIVWIIMTRLLFRHDIEDTSAEYI